MSKRRTPLCRKAHFEVKMYKTPHACATFGSSDVFSPGRRKGLCPKKMAGVGHLKRICKAAFSLAGAVQETCSSELLGGPGADYLRGVAFWSLRSSGLLRWFCVTGAALRMTWHHFFVAGAAAQTDRLDKSQDSLVWGRQLCTQLSIFEGRLAELLRSSCCQLKKKEVSQNCFVFNVVKCKNWGSLAELLRFWCCQV